MTKTAKFAAFTLFVSLALIAATLSTVPFTATASASSAVAAQKGDLAVSVDCSAATWPATCGMGGTPVRMITIGEQQDGSTILMRLPAPDIASR